MHDVAAAEDEHTAVSQRCQGSAELEVVIEGFGGIDRQLHHRDVRGRKSVHQHGPGAVVESPAVAVLPDPGGMGEVRNLLRELRVTWRRVLNTEQLVRKAEEIVDRPRP